MSVICPIITITAPPGTACSTICYRGANIYNRYCDEVKDRSYMSYYTYAVLVVDWQSLPLTSNGALLNANNDIDALKADIDAELAGYPTGPRWYHGDCI